MQRLKAWGRPLTSPALVGRALRYAVVVGSLLILINHGDAILHGKVSLGRALRMGLTALVPFAVSALSSTDAMRGRPDAPPPAPPPVPPGALAEPAHCGEPEAGRSG